MMMSDKITWTNTTVHLGELKPWANNPRMSTKAQAKRILESFAKFGQPLPVAIGPDNEVYDGHQRLSALLTIHGPDYVLDARRSNRALTDDERRGLVLALHNAAGSWNWDALSGWDADDLKGWGFDGETLKAWNNDANNLKEFLKSSEPETVDAEPQIDRAEELREKWQTASGQLWQLGEHRLFVGDCTVRENVERLMGGERADMVFTDPPYGISIVQNNKVGGENLAAVGNYSPVIGDETTETARLFYLLCIEFGFTDFILWGGNYFTDFLKPSSCWIVWDKRGEMNSNNFADCELAWCSCDKPARVYKQVWAGMIREGEHDKRVHPTQKPVRVTQDIMTDFPAYVYYDGFAGSGTTIIAAHNLNRRCYAMEISEKYGAVILERFYNATGITPVLVD